MNNYLWFMAGFCAGIIPCVSLAFWYYRGALKRVRAIQQSVEHYRNASQIVHAAAKDIYGKSNKSVKVRNHETTTKN